MHGWNTSCLLGWPIFRDYVSFREGNHITNPGMIDPPSDAGVFFWVHKIQIATGLRGSGFRMPKGYATHHLDVPGPGSDRIKGDRISGLFHPH